MMRDAFLAIDAILRDRSDFADGRSRLLPLLLIFVFGSCYGALMGTLRLIFFGGVGARNHLA